MMNMEITQQQYDKTKTFSKTLSNVEIDNLTMLNALLNMVKNGCIPIPFEFFR